LTAQSAPSHSPAGQLSEQGDLGSSGTEQTTKVSPSSGERSLQTGRTLSIAQGHPERIARCRTTISKLIEVDKRDRSLDADLTRALALLLRVRAHHPPNPRELGALAGHAQPSGRARVGRPRLPRVGRPHFSVRHRLEGGRRQGAQGLPLPKLLFGSKAPGDARLLADQGGRDPLPGPPFRP
jgi:hypothetical protein